MAFEKKITQQSDPYRQVGNNQNKVSNVYWGEVTSIEDNTDGGRIKVKIPELDTQTPNENLPYCYPMMPKFLHIYPKVGEVVRIILEDTDTPQRSRYWVGSVISQLQNVKFDNVYRALSTTNVKQTQPLRAESTYPKAKGVFPDKKDIGIIGRDNTDIILKEREVHIRAGKHTIDNVLELNRKNPATQSLYFEEISGDTRSMLLHLADKIAFISHDGIPKFSAADITQDERNRIVSKAHPMVRGDVLAEILEIFRKAILNHIHPYSNLPSDKSGIILDLEKVNLESFKQNNILIN
jgi:hypothetical protein